MSNDTKCAEHKLVAEEADVVGDIAVQYLAPASQFHLTFDGAGTDSIFPALSHCEVAELEIVELGRFCDLKGVVDDFEKEFSATGFDINALLVCFVEGTDQGKVVVDFNAAIEA